MEDRWEYKMEDRGSKIEIEDRKWQQSSIPSKLDDSRKSKTWLIRIPRFEISPL